MLIDSVLPKSFWDEAGNIACYLTYKCLIRSFLNKYELVFNRKPRIDYFKTFGCKCFMQNNGKRELGKLDSKSYEAPFVGYSSTSKAYRVFNIRNCVLNKVFRSLMSQEVK